MTSDFQIKGLKQINELNLWLDFKFSTDALNIRNTSHDPHLFIVNLLDKDLLVDAINLLALIMTKLDAIWWAELCCKSIILNTDHNSITIHKLVVDWLRTPEESLRRQLESTAREHDLALPICWVAMAIFWHSGSITPLGEPEILAAEEMSLKAVQGAVHMATVFVDPVNSQMYRKQFVQIGLDIMAGVLQFTQWKAQKIV